MSSRSAKKPSTGDSVASRAASTRYRHHQDESDAESPSGSKIPQTPSTPRSSTVTRIDRKTPHKQPSGTGGKTVQQKLAQAALRINALTPPNAENENRIAPPSKTGDHQSVFRSAINAMRSDPTAAESSGKESEAVGDTGVLQPTKRKDIDNSPVKVTKKLRSTEDLPSDIHFPAAPPRAHLLTRSHYQNGPGNVEIRHRVSLPHVTNNVLQHGIMPYHPNLLESSPAAVPQNQHYVEYLKKQNQHLEIQLCNRNFEYNRQVEEIRKANAWAFQAKGCMRKDGDDINHLKMLILYAKNKVEVWDKMLQPLAAMDSPSAESDKENEEETAADGMNLSVASRIIQDAQDVIGNFEKALREVITRPVHQLEEPSDHVATFRV